MYTYTHTHRKLVGCPATTPEVRLQSGAHAQSRWRHRRQLSHRFGGNRFESQVEDPGWGSASHYFSHEGHDGENAGWAWDCLVCAMTRWYVWRDSLDVYDVTRWTCVTWPVDMCYVTCSYEWKGCRMSERLSCMCHDSLICVTWLVNTLTWLVDMWTWLVDMWTWLVMSVRLPCMCHDSLICVPWLVNMLTWLFDMCTWPVDVCDVTHSYEWRGCVKSVELPCMCHDSLICVTWLVNMGWLRLVGSLKW